ncbi:MAG TPA: hypothetical protein VGE74_26495 [Gemmata sp.]
MTTIRRPGAASATVLIGLIACLIGANLLAPEWARRTGLDVWNYAALDAERQAATETRAEMDAKAERNCRRRARADQLAMRLVTRDTTLEGASLEIMEMFRDDPGSRCALEAHNPGVRDLRLLFARHTIQRATRLISHDPGRQNAVRERLEADYRVLETTWGPQPVQ